MKPTVSTNKKNIIDKKPKSPISENATAHGNKKIISQWINRSSTIGKNVSVLINDKLTSGKAMKLDSDGALIISKGKKTIRLLVGDITHND